MTSEYSEQIFLSEVCLSVDSENLWKINAEHYNSDSHRLPRSTDENTQTDHPHHLTPLALNHPHQRESQES